MKRIALLGLVILMLATLLPLPIAAAATYGTVTGGWLRLRTAPSYDAAILKSYNTGTVVEILGTSGDWYNVKTPDNKAGYMLKAYVTLGGGGSGGTGTTAYVVSSNGFGVRMRSGPSTSYRVLAVYNVGTTVTVLQTGVLWSRIQVGTTVGYMMSEFLTSSPSPTTPPSTDMATVRSDNGLGVRLRTGPGTGYATVGIYSVGTRVSVITRGTTWDYIQVGTRYGYMMNYFLTYDSATLPIATGITLTAAAATGMQDEVLALTASVTGTNLSSPAYTLAVTGNPSMAEISGGNLHILNTATVGAVIQVTATSVNNNASGVKITATCNVTVTAAAPRVTSFAFDQTTASPSIAGGDVSLRIGYSLLGYHLTAPYFSLALSSAAGSNVTTSIDTTNEEIVLNISSAIAVGTVFTVTGTTAANDAGGNPKTAVLTVTITNTAPTLTSIELVPAAAALRHDETANINATLHYSDGTYIANVALTTKYTLAITTGASYGSLSGKLLVPNAAALTGVANQTLVITGTSVDNPALTDTCEVLLYGRNVPGAPVLTAATPAYQSVALTWTAPTNDGGDDLTGYKAYYSLTEGGAKNLLSDAILASATTYTATGLINGTQYYFWVTADNAQGDGAYSNFLTATPNATAPSAPQTLAAPAADIHDGEVKLTWTAPADTGGSGVTISHYRVYIDDGTNPPYEFDAAGRSTNLYKVVTGLTNGHTYNFLVLACNSASILGPTASVSANSVGTPDAPTVSYHAHADGSITIQWVPGASNAGHAITSYEVYYKVASADDSTAVHTTVSGVTEKTISSLTNGTEYQLWVTAYNGYYNSVISNRVNETPAP